MIPYLKSLQPSSSRSSAIAALSAAVLVLTTTRAHAQGVLEDLGTLPGAAGAVAYGVSADGAVIVGTSGARAFRWTAQSGMRDLGTLPGASDADAWGISNDASVIVGGSGGRAYRWTAATGMQDLGLPPGASSAGATEVSADGNVVVGVAHFGAASMHVFRWSAGTGMQDLGAMGAPYAWPTGVSGDGSVVVGNVDWTHGFIWTQATGMYDPFAWYLGYSEVDGVSDDGTTVVGVLWDMWNSPPNSYALDLPTYGIVSPVGNLPPQEISTAAAVNADGSAIVGGFGWPSSVYRWTAGAGLEHLGALPGLAAFEHFPSDVSADGSVVVGRALTAVPGVERAFRWVPEIGASYCTANPNSTGQPASIAAFGSELLGDNDVVLVTTGVATDQFGYYLTSATQDFVPNFAGSEGNLCLGGKIHRLAEPPTGELLFSGPEGVLTFRPDLTDLPQGLAFQVGETWSFQSWFRDVVGPGSTSNTSDGVAITWR